MSMRCFKFVVDCPKKSAKLYVYVRNQNEVREATPDLLDQKFIFKKSVTAPVLSICV